MEMGGYLLGSESEFHVWWRFDPIDNVRGRLRVHATGGKDLSINNVVELLGVLARSRMDVRQAVGRDASFYAGQYLFLVSAIMSAVHWFRGGQWYHANKANACFRSYNGDQAQQGSVIERVRDRRLGGARSG